MISGPVIELQRANQTISLVFKWFRPFNVGSNDLYQVAANHWISEPEIEPRLENKAVNFKTYSCEPKSGLD